MGPTLDTARPSRVEPCRASSAAPPTPRSRTSPTSTRCSAPGRPLTGLRFQDLDLTAYEERLLARTDVEGLVVLGGRLSPALSAHLGAHRALVFPTDPHAPVTPTARRSTPRTSSTPDSTTAATSRPRTSLPTSGCGTVRCTTTPSSPCCARSMTTRSATPSTSSRRVAPVVGVMGGHALARAPPGMPRRRGSVAPSPRRGWSWPPVAGPARWRRPTSEPSPRDEQRSRLPWTGWPPCRRSARRWPTGSRWPSRCGPPSRSRTRGAASASPPGSTATSRPTSSATASASTSPTRSARTACWRARRPGSSCWRAPPARCRRSSRP